MKKTEARPTKTTQKYLASRYTTNAAAAAAVPTVDTDVTLGLLRVVVEDIRGGFKSVTSMLQKQSAAKNEFALNINWRVLLVLVIFDRFVLLNTYKICVNYTNEKNAPNCTLNRCSIY